MMKNGICRALSRREFLAGAGAALASSCVFAGTDAAMGTSTPVPHGEPLQEARWYEKLKQNVVRCTLCPRRCVVPDGKRGYCEVRENRGGKYYSLVYGYPVAVHMDPIEKKPFMHVYPGTKAFSIATVGCNITCRFCQNWEISQSTPEQISARYVSPKQIAQAAVKAGAKTIAYTYSEPTVFCEYMIDCAKAGNDLGIGSVVVSNGFILPEAQKELFKVVKAIKVDFKAFNKEFYRDICDGYLKPVKDSLKRIAGSGTWLEIVVLLIPTLNDSPDELKGMSEWIVKELGDSIPVIFTRYHPAYKIRNIPPTPQKTLERAIEITRDAGCKYVYGGNVAGMKGSDTHCPKCGTVVVERYYHTLLSAESPDGKCPKCGFQVPGVWL